LGCQWVASISKGHYTKTCFPKKSENSFWNGSGSVDILKYGSRATGGKDCKAKLTAVLGGAA